MKKKIAIVLTLILTLPLLLGVPMVVYGSDEETNSITIIKYRIPEGVIIPVRPIGDVEIDITYGLPGVSSLERMPGVTYRIVRVEYIDGEYFPMTGPDAMTMDIVTNALGVATTGPLPDGIYQVIEMPHELIPVREPTITIHLPMRRTGGEYLRDVILYPKSNVVDPVEVPPGCDCEDCDCEECDCDCDCDPEWTPPRDPPKRLPQTAGDIGSLMYLLAIGGGLLTLGGFGIFQSKKRGL